MIAASSESLMALFYLLCPWNIKTIFLAAPSLVPLPPSPRARALMGDGRVEI
jgi:hypothetical protein